MLKWIEQLLIDRLQCVRVNGYYYNFIAELIGVPQGSVLGPILFIILINDIWGAIREDGYAKLFADDVKLYLHISCNNSSFICRKQSLHCIIGRKHGN